MDITDYNTDQEALQAKEQDDKDKYRRQMKALVTNWCERVDFGRKHVDEYRKRWADDRKWARGDVDWLVRANLIGAIMEVLAAFLYAKNPDVKVSPSDSVNRERISAYREFAQTITVIVSRLWKDAGLKKMGKKWVRQSMTVGIGWLKVSMQTRTEQNTLVEEEINDLMKNMANIEAYEERLAAGDELGVDEQEELTMKAKIESNMKALEAQKEIMVAEGLVIDPMAPEDVTVAPECGDVENYLRAPWIAIDYYKTKHETMTLVDWDDEKKEKKLNQANLYHKRPRNGDATNTGGDYHPNYYRDSGSVDADDESAESKDGFVRVTEIWCKDDGMVYTMIDGIKDCWAREPYAPTTGRRFYPVFDLCCHPIDGESYPQSDVYQLKELQEEYNRTRSNYAEHRQRAVPGLVFNTASITEESVKKLERSTTQEMVGIELTRPDTPIQSVITPKAYSAVDMNLYDTRQITAEMEKISGAQDALQSSVQVEKTATEAKIQEAGFGARSGARRDALEDSLTEMAEYTAQLVLQTFTQAEAITYAGQQAVWVDMTTDEALMMFDVSIKAGSTGKPKANNDREIWGTLLPLIEKMIDRIGQARMMGQEWAAKPLIALLDETMRRLDDPAEIEKFLPVPPEPDPEAQKPDEETQAQIMLDKAKTEAERADVLKTITETGASIPPNIAMMYLLFGGDALANQQQGMNGQQPAMQEPALEEAPNPVE